MTERVASSGPYGKATDLRLRRPLLRVLAHSAVTLSLLAACATANAEGRVTFLSDRLAYPPSGSLPDDFRVRMNAALALGTTNDEAAVTPLCAGLNDPSDAVRQTAAAALARLGKPSAGECLRRRESQEKRESVREQIHKSIASIAAAEARAAAAAGGTATGDNPNARFYVVLSPISNNTARANADIESVAYDAIRAKLTDLGAFVVIVAGRGGELSPAQIQKRGLKGYYLSTTVEKFKTAGGALSVQVKLAVLTFPGKALRGELSPTASLAGAQVGDRNAEDQLLSAVAANAAAQFAQNFH